MKRKILLGFAVFATFIGGGIAGASLTGGGNDAVLHEADHEINSQGGYYEVFKKEGSNKNYLYTVTHFVDDFGRKCTVVTADSEQTISLSCK